MATHWPRAPVRSALQRKGTGRAGRRPHRSCAENLANRWRRCRSSMSPSKRPPRFLEAFKAFSLGEKGSARERHQRRSALSSARHRTRSEFCHRLPDGGRRLQRSRPTGRATEYYTRAFQLRDHASDREKHSITAAYYRNVTGELDKAAQTYQEQIDSYPRELAGYNDGWPDFSLQGNYEQGT